MEDIVRDPKSGCCPPLRWLCSCGQSDIQARVNAYVSSSKTPLGKKDLTVTQERLNQCYQNIDMKISTLRRPGSSVG